MKYLMLENIRSAHNVGSIFRTADGAGVFKLFLIGYTPAPIDRFGRRQPAIAKTSLGASETVPWEQHPAPVAVLQQLQQEGYTVVAVEQTNESEPLARLVVPERVVYVVGNEVTGVSEPVLALADRVVALPMCGAKESLNVAVATGIVLYHGLDT